MKNCVGPWVEGDNFWGRESEVCALREALTTGESLLLQAPRRVGKTSLVRETFRRMEAAGDRCFTLFVDVQDCVEPHDLIAALSQAALPHAGLASKLGDLVRTAVRGVSGRLKAIGGVELREAAGDAWPIRGDRLISALAGADRPVIICVDELPVMVSRLLQARKGDPADAQHLLLWLRRSCTQYPSKVRWIFCGSIGLEPVARRFGLSHTIAHLKPLHLAPWSRQAADGCLAALATAHDLELAPAVRAAIMDRMKIFIPHHVQLYFSHVLQDCRARKVTAPTEKDVRRVYDRQMLGTRGHAALADYEERLLRVLGSEETTLALALLTEAAMARTLAPAAIHIIASEYESDPARRFSRVQGVIDVLEHDGYLVRARGAIAAYKFPAGLIRDWWKRRFSLGYTPVHKRQGR